MGYISLNLRFHLFKKEYTLNESSETSQFLFYHRFLEASKFAFSKRTLLADEYFSNFDDV